MKKKTLQALLIMFFACMAVYCLQSSFPHHTLAAILFGVILIVKKLKPFGVWVTEYKMKRILLFILTVKKHLRSERIKQIKILS